ncbi:MAG TPA: DUF1802 family protein [Chthoniobacterales bacterium]
MTTAALVETPTLVAFKEWALVCAALERGETSLILRKGGIAEGRAGFRFKHSDFFLFPTFFHEQLERTRLNPDTPVPSPEPGTITITARATVEWTELVTDPATLEKLTPLHILQSSVVDERFHYGKESEIPAINVAFLRVWKLKDPWRFPDAPKYGGCRSWIDLPELPADFGESPVLTDEEHARRAATLKELLSR